MPRFCCVQQSPQSVRDDRKRKNEEDVNDIFDVQNEAHVQNDATKAPPELFILISKYVFPKIRSLCFLSSFLSLASGLFTKDCYCYCFCQSICCQLVVKHRKFLVRTPYYSLSI